MPEKYDVIIIGAGIGGLVCGCYLAKAGMNVLILEQHSKPGGYCTSFKRRGFVFDAAAHSLGGLRYGSLGNIFEELDVGKKITIDTFDPSNIILSPDYRISFRSEIDQTVLELQKTFPLERNNIPVFFNLLVENNAHFSMSIRKWTFKRLLDKYFRAAELKAILAAPLLGNTGLPPSRLAAFLGVKIFREFLLGGGKYIRGGMQKLPDVLAETFRESGGELRLSSPAKSILVERGTVRGIVDSNGNSIESKYVVSNGDARETFLMLIGKEHLPVDFQDLLRNMRQSLSAFIAYLIIDKNYRADVPYGSNVWFLDDYDLDKVYEKSKRTDSSSSKGFVFHFYPDKQRIFAFMNAAYKTKNYWKENKEAELEKFIHLIDTKALKGLSRNIIYREAATPETLSKYTRNYKGATFGWECSPGQLALSEFRKPSFVKRLYLSGHWSTKGFGIPGVAYVGRDTAAMIIRRERPEIRARREIFNTC